jgi:hypothetical protein
MKRPGTSLVAVLLPLLILAGCSAAPTEEELNFKREHERMRAEREAFRKRMVTGREGEEAVRLVQEAPSPAADTSNADWVAEQIDRLPGAVLFPRWEARRTSPAAYEVMVTYTHIDRKNAVALLGHVWEVNLMLRQISEPRPLTPDEIAARGPDLRSREGDRKGPLDPRRLE